MLAPSRATICERFPHVDNTATKFRYSIRLQKLSHRAPKTRGLSFRVKLFKYPLSTYDYSDVFFWLSLVDLIRRKRHEQLPDLVACIGEMTSPKYRQPHIDPAALNSFYAILIKVQLQLACIYCYAEAELVYQVGATVVCRCGQPPPWRLVRPARLNVGTA